MKDVPPVLVISLRSSSVRRERIASALSALGVPWEFVDAVDGDALSEDELRSAAGASALEFQPALGRRLARGEIGCALSHQLCYRRIIDDGIPSAFIFEDDVHVPSEFVEIACAVPRFPRGWEMVLFAHHSARHDTNEGAETCLLGIRVHGRHRVARVAEFPMGAMAYLLTRKAASRLLDYGMPVRMPADWLTGYAPSAGVSLYAVTPPCIVPDPEVAETTTILGRGEPGGDATPLVSPSWRSSGRLRSWGGIAWLWLRKTGVYPGAYSREL